ncbi:phage tail spike protein [Streptococcus dysgalactiae]|uniref:phage tail spike protein n=1 Tax=Streptococcus dysgalactiae TaxID=1334 RepID=UPI001FAA2918|nr:phage tail spike protein [Streptococcus dysgalactiae]
MLLTIHDANLQKVAFIDNDKQSTLNYYDDTWTRNLETGSSTFEFTVFKKAIKSDTASHKTYNHLNEKAFVSFKHHGKSYVFSVMTVEENEQTIKCYCENLNLELINEYANPYKAAKAMSFVEYCNAMDLLNFTHLSVGINEISDQKRTLEWEGQDTKLARLLSLATKFDAEIDFDTELNSDSSIKSFKVNVYHEYDDKHQGVGRVRNDIQLTYGKNLKSIKRTVDKTGIYNAVRPTGKGKTKGTDGNEVETIVTIGSLGVWSENNADGVREFYQSGEMLYAPLSMQMYPSTFTSGTQSDQWIRKDIEVESDNPTVIRAAGIRDLKKNAYPALTYDVDGFLDVEIGDTVRIYDDGFTPVLLIKARVSDQKISFTNPKSNRTTFANFKALKNNLSSGIQSAFERLFEAAKPYTIKLATDNGVIFKNQIGQSLVTPTLYKGGKPIVAGVTWRWSLNEEVTTGMTYLVKGSSVTDTVTLTVAAYIGNDEVAVDEISFVNVVDGKLGTPGRTPYLHIAYSASNNGSQGFSTTDSTNKTYIGTYTDYTQADSQDYRVYKWTLIKGADGNGIANVTNYYLATAASTGITKNSLGWTTIPQTMTEEKRYLWNYRVELYTNGTSKTTDPAIIGVHGLKGDKGGFSEEQLNEVNKKIDSKADQVLTQEQLNALNEKAQLLDAEMKAKASMEAFSELEKAYNAFVENNAKDTAKSEKDLIEAGRRIELLTTQFGGLAELKTFIDTYMKSTNEGLIIGKNDASSTIKVSSDRISMFSAGREVMYISQGVIHIDNGIFTASVQIGKFRTEQYHLNADMNVIRYVG